MNRHLQFLVSAAFALVSGLNLVFFIVVFSKLKENLTDDISYLDSKTQSLINERIMSNLNFLGQLVIGFNIFSIIIAFLIGSLFLNHIAGPVYAVQRILNEMAEGQKVEKHMVLRKYDFFNDLAQSLNRLIDKTNSENDKQLKLEK